MTKRPITEAQRRALDMGRQMRWKRRPPRKPATGLSAVEYRVRLLTPDSPQVRKVVQEIVAVQQELATPQPQDAPLIGLLGMTLVIARMAAADILQHGLEGADGKERPSVRIYLEAARRAGELCDRLAIGPAARARLGLGSKSLRDVLGEALLSPSEEVTGDGPGAQGGDVAA